LDVCYRVRPIFSAQASFLHWHLDNGIGQLARRVSHMAKIGFLDVVVDG